MQAATIPGVPDAMQRDGWWFGGSFEPPAQDAARSAPGGAAMMRVAILLALVVLADVLLWREAVGVSLAVFCAALGLVAIRMSGLRAQAAVQAIFGLVLAILPLVELVQPLSVVIAGVGVSLVLVFVAGLRRDALGWGAVRLWWIGPVMSVRDLAGGMRAFKPLSVTDFDTGRVVMTWALPVGLGGVFAVLLIGANPVMDQWMVALGNTQLPTPDIARWVFWALIALGVWPCIVIARLAKRLAPRPARRTVRRAGLINAASVIRSLILFNMMFAVQTGMDAVLLSGGADLPEGMTYATYAHRGAYPLLVTALLAGLFAVLARPFADQSPAVRVLLLVWLGQTLALVLASVVRLDAYIDAYGLTRLRMAAFVWMGIVAAGLCVVVWQVAARMHTGWMLVRAGAIGAAAVYACAFVSFDGMIARHNLAQAEVQGRFYICASLGEGALPAILSYQARTGLRLCAHEYGAVPTLFEPHDWREWGFRNARMRHSVAQTVTDRMIP